MKEIWIQYKIPDHWDIKQALEFKNLWWDNIEDFGISCDTGIGFGLIDIHAMCETNRQVRVLSLMLEGTEWEIVQ